MVEVKVLLYGKLSCFHCGTHVAVVITNLDNHDELLVEYGADDSYYRLNLDLARQERGDCCVGVVRLYSNKDFNLFRQEYNREFKSEDYSYLYNNCADAANFVLNYFFSDANFENSLYLSFQLLCSIGCVATLGLCCFPAPPVISTPRDVYQKAQLLSCRYGVLEEASEQLTFAPRT